MDEELDQGNENVNSVLAQESSELFHILSRQSPAVILKLYQMLPSGVQSNMGPLYPTSFSSDVTELVRAMLAQLEVGSAADCCNFLQSMCILCENIPMHLESKLMSVAGYGNSECDISAPSVTKEESSSPPSDQQLVKRPRIDHWENYIAAVKGLLLQRWERVSEGLVKEVQLENVWVSLRMVNRGRDRPDQTPGPADRGSRTPVLDRDLESSESKVTLETFLQGCAGKVTVVVGQAGSGKTLLMSYLGQQWACGLGPIPSSSLFVLLEFRQLNMLSRPLSLSKLLFQHYLPPSWGNNEKRDIVDYLISNPEQSCWVLDGYDEFYSKLPKQGGEMQEELLDPENPLPVADLVSGLINRKLLPGCTVLVTCRVRDLMDFEGISDKVGQLLGWDCHEIKEYVDNFFGVRENSALGVQAVDLLLSSRHLLSMSYLPSLCNICCICLKHLVMEYKAGEAKAEPREEDRGTEMGRKATEKNLNGDEAVEEKRGQDQDTRMHGTNRSAQHDPALALIPSTLTQVYLTVIGAFLSLDPDKGGKTDKAETTKPLQSTVRRLSQYRSQVCDLSQVAWRGLVESKIVFLKEDIPQEVLEFSLTNGLFSQVELRLEDGMLVSAYCFIHLTIQEFLAALRIMTSNDVSDTQLKKRFSLKTRWTTKSDQRTVFTDSLHLYLCGLASPDCTPALVQLAKASGVSGVQNWVQKRQAFVQKLLSNLCHSNTLTGPKTLELCHCLQESQDQQLARQVVGKRPILELRNISLWPNDIEALAFVANSVGNNGIGLDFGACSMELECLEVLPRCQYINYLSFHSRKYNDKFAEKLSSILPEFTTLRKLDFYGSSLTAAGAASLACALEKCQNITEINLSDNSLKDKGIKHIADIFSKLPKILSVMLGRNNSSLKAVNYLIENMSSCSNVQHVHADAVKEVNVSFSQNSDMNSLLNQNWDKPEMQKVAKSLACCPGLSVLDLSGGYWDVEILKALTEFLPKFNVTNKIILNNSCSSVEGMVTLTALLPKCPAVVFSYYLTLSFSFPFLISTFFIFSLSCNSFGNKGLKKLLDALPCLTHIQEINASKNEINMEGVMMLAGAFCSSHNLTETRVRYSALKCQKVVSFCRMNKSSLLASDMTTLCRRLIQCRSNLELDLSQCSLKDKVVKNLLNVLPKMASLQKLNFSYSYLSTTETLSLVQCLTVSQRVTSVVCLLTALPNWLWLPLNLMYFWYSRLSHFSLNTDSLETLVGILQQVPQLSYLDLSSNQLKDEGVKYLVDSLPALKIHSYVNLSNNRLTQEGLLEVANTLRTCDNVSGVEVSLGEEERCLISFRQYGHCEKTLRVFQIISSIVAIHTHFTAFNGKIIGDKLLMKQSFASSSNYSVNVFVIEESWIKAEKAIGLLCHCLKLSKSIQTISLVDCAVEGHQLAPMTSVIRGCPSLTELHFSLNTLGAEGAEFLCDVLPSLPKLNSLSIISKESCASVIEKMSEALLQSTTVQMLNLSGHTISNTSAQTLTRVLPQLRSLNLSHCLWSATGGLQLVGALRECVNLEALYLDSVHLDENITECLVQALRSMHLRILKLNRSDTVVGPSEASRVLDILAAMEVLAQMEEIELEGWRMANRGVEQLTRLLPIWQKLKKIRLSKNVINDQSGDKLLEALISCGQLQELHLGSNLLGDLTAARMALVLPSTHITVLDVSENSIGHEGAVSLSKAIMCMKNLTKIHLTSVGTPMLCPVAASLIHCPLIQDVGLGWNNCGDDVALELARVMPSCQKMIRIDLESNHLSVVGVEALCRALQSCPDLQLIRLWRNKVVPSEAQKLSLNDKRLNFSST
uniref:NACHT domain-containing protein n=1 Tax=Echeneis naucrates TaxID=173247 RepID=A0A665UU16_ECHNA